MKHPEPPAVGTERNMLRAQLLLVLALSLGQSAVYAVVNLLDKLSREPLAQQTTRMNTSLNDRQYFDLTYQLLDIGFSLVPVALVFFFLHQAGRNGFRLFGFDGRRPWPDAGWGLLLFGAIGVGTLGVYAAGRALGITTAIVPAALDPFWWTIPVLVLSAVRHGILEEVVVVGFLFHVLRRIGWGPWAVIVASALFRGSYHLYQGFGPFIGNALMGLAFGWFYHRYGRVMPLVIAHALLDSAGFVGYALLGPAIGIGS
ncbi:CPBP family intramembrane glutamic endopeptidase [Zafaria sp. Z1313]|uniref:CPBP family intramembrane glutamic endopeptidase n=1 Tax=unclassified Zafaria TaxID=2828765 RepID=UPI002E77A3D3|nr:CPBP family intramembrane glutamic endopeptidase [Zafaria sp. J156]MEE1620035.1 CPBP family intramembrane glutamic endopeptidase [Zafaria sp. J156]